MRVLIAASILALSVNDAFGAAFYAEQRVTASGLNPPPPPPAVIYDGDLPPDGRYAASVTYVGEAGFFTARGASAIDVDLRAGTFNLSNSAVNSCYRSPVCGVSVSVGVPSSFVYSDTLSVWAPGASATTRNFVEFAFRTTGVLRYNTGGPFGTAVESIVSSLSLVDASDGSLAASASIDRLCTTSSGCTRTPTATATFDPIAETFAEASPTIDRFSNPVDLLRVRVPVHGEFSVLDLSLGMAFFDESSQADFLSVLSLVGSPGLVVTGTHGYLLQPRAVPEPGLPFFLFGGTWVLWSLRRRRAPRRLMSPRSIAC